MPPLVPPSSACAGAPSDAAREHRGAGAAGSGTGQVTVTLPGGYPGLGLTAQGVILEGGSANSIVFSNAVQLIIP